ncbi:Lrp/AsnC family transcriptional regulator [Parasphingorhabdus pacifica]
MHESPTVDEIDLSLIHALQISPRCTWSSLAGVLGTAPSTLTRRWARLTREGLAWFSCYPVGERGRGADGWQTGAFVEVECFPGDRGSVMDALAGMNSVWNIDATSGRRELMLTVMASSILELDEEVATSIGTVAGVRATRTHFFRRIFREGSSWRLDALSPAQQRALSPAASRTVPGRLSDRDREVLKMLGPDARVPASAVAARLGCSVGTAGRWVDRLLRSEQVSVRCEVAHYVAGWQVAATLWLDVPQEDLTRVATGIGRLQQVRLCATIGSEANLVAQVWLHRMEDLDGFEEFLATEFSGSRVLDRWITPRFAKRLGHVLHPDGRRFEFVPLVAD